MNEPQKQSACAGATARCEAKFKLAYWELPDESNRVLVECRKMVADNKMRVASEPT